MKAEHKKLGLAHARHRLCITIINIRLHHITLRANPRSYKLCGFAHVYFTAKWYQKFTMSIIKEVKK